MTGSVRLKPVFIVGLLLFALVAFVSQGVRGEEELDEVSEVQCRPYIEKAIKNLEAGPHDESNNEEQGDEHESNETNEATDEQVSSQPADSKEDGSEENGEIDLTQHTDDNDDDSDDTETAENKSEIVESNQVSEEEIQDDKTDEEGVKSNSEEEEQSVENTETDADENVGTNEEDNESLEAKSQEAIDIQSNENEIELSDNEEQTTDDNVQSDENDKEEAVEDSVEDTDDNGTIENDSNEPDDVVSNDENDDSKVVDDASIEEIKSDEKSAEMNVVDSSEEVGATDDNITDEKTAESGEEKSEESDKENDVNVNDDDNDDHDETSKQMSGESTDNDTETLSREERSLPEENNEESKEISSNDAQESEEEVENATTEDENDRSTDESTESTPEEELIEEIEIPENLRPREHINQILRLDVDNEDTEAAIERSASIVLKDLKKLYDTAIQPLETLYKYRDLSNRHFGDPEIFSKPLILFMGPWSGGKSSIINYLLDNEYKPTALRTGGLQECIGESCKPPNATDAGAEPSPAYFNILMYGEEEEVLDGTQLAADWTFSGLQKFGQGMLDRLRGLKLKNKLLEKVNIVEIPGILEIRKQVQRLFPFNDACQWFIDRADIIFLVYDPSKLDVGPETEAILDQLKGREYQTRIILNKADQVKPEELMRVQGALIWNISPLMSSAEPPIMYSTSLWSLPYEAGAPTRLLYAQERAFLRDLRTAVDKRVEHKIASARRFAVRVRNHAKMVDCYLTTYYNHKTFFGSAKETSDKIIENPQEYHIYEGLSTLTNISRYDLPDPDVYRDFFRLNKLHDFSLLSSTCTYFRGCPINRLDVAIAYDLPELVGKYKKSVESTINEKIDGKPPAS